MNTIFHDAILNAPAYHRICAERRLEQPDPAFVAALLDISFLMDPDKNNLFEPKHLDVYQDMTKPIGDYFLYSSHNTYIAGNQLYGRASLDAIEKALLAGVRVIELDCMDGTGKYQNQIVVKHRFTPMHPILLSSCLRVVQRCAFQTSAYPVILTIENHCGSHEQQRSQALMLRDILGDLLHIPSLMEQRSSKFRSPLELCGKILLRHKYKVYDLHTSTPTREPSPPPNNVWFDEARRNKAIMHVGKKMSESVQSGRSTSPTPSSSPIRHDGRRKRSSQQEVQQKAKQEALVRTEESSSVPPSTTHASPKTTQVQVDREKALEIYETKIEQPSLSSTTKPSKTIISKLPFGKKARKSKKAIDQRLSRLVMISNQKVKVKTLNVALRSPFVFSCSWGEGKMKRALASRKVLMKTMAFCQRHLMRVYPAYYRLDSSNFGPQKVWNAGVQMVALNTQTCGRHQALNAAKFHDNGRCGYVLKPKWLRSDSDDRDMEYDDGNDEIEIRGRTSFGSFYGTSSTISSTGTSTATTTSSNTTNNTNSNTNSSIITSTTGANDTAPLALNITPIACWLPHTMSSSILSTISTTSTTSTTTPTSTSTISTFTTSATSSTPTTPTAIPKESEHKDCTSSSNKRSSSPNTTTNKISGNTGEQERDHESYVESNGGVVLHAVVVGADPHGLTYRKMKRTTSPSTFHGGTRANVVQGNGSAANSSSGYAAWRWNESAADNTLSFRVFPPRSRNDGMELVYISLTKEGNKRKKEIAGQFCIAFANMRPGIRVVELFDNSGHSSGARLLLDVQVVRHENDAQQTEDEYAMLKKVSSSNCLKL